MESRIKYYHYGKGCGWIEDPTNSENVIYFHISDVVGELRELIETRKVVDEQVTFKTEESKVEQGRLEACDVRINFDKRAV